MIYVPNKPQLPARGLRRLRGIGVQPLESDFSSASWQAGDSRISVAAGESAKGSC